jgi:DNA polymerase-3 subunit epsilon
MLIEMSFDKNGKFTTSVKKSTSPQREKGKSLLELPNQFIIVDIETTGFNTIYDDIIEIGCLKVEKSSDFNYEVIDSFDSLIKTEDIPEEIVELTGITEEMLNDAPERKVVLNSFKEFIGDSILVAHNANFDINFLYDNLLIHLKYKLQNNFVDTLRISRRAFPDFKKHKLSFLKEQLNLSPTTSHRALGDCHTTLELFSLCAKRIDEFDISLKRKSKNTRLANSITPTENAVFDEDSPVFEKYFVFTGTLSKMVRKEAMQLVVDLGGNVSDGVNSKTNFLVMGAQDYSRFTDGKESSKTKKARGLIEKGKDLEIISENDFYEMIYGIDIRF